MRSRLHKLYIQNFVFAIQVEFGKCIRKSEWSIRLAFSLLGIT